MTNTVTYFESLNWKNREWWIREEIVATERLKMNTSLKNFAFDKLLGFAYEGKKTKKLQYVPNYDILANQDYFDKLLYVPCILPIRSAYTISSYKNPLVRVASSDLVRIAVDLPYLPDDKAREFEFSTEYLAE